MGGERVFWKKKQKKIWTDCPWINVTLITMTTYIWIWINAFAGERNEDVGRGKGKSYPSGEVCVQKVLFSRSFNFVFLLLRSTAYWPWPPCNVWCLHCHNSSWVSAECVSIACWCVLRSGKVSGKREGEGVEDGDGVRWRKHPDSSLIRTTIKPLQLLLGSCWPS